MTKQKSFFLVRLLVIVALVFNIAPRTALAAPAQVGPTTPYPILFVTQPPVRADFTTIGSVFGNHLADVQSAVRGGDLWIRYTDGTLKNLTAAVGFGSTGAAGFQDHNAIAVRDPSVSWDGTKALFSMVIGSVEQRYEVQTYYWQIYEVTGMGVGETTAITKVPNQPANFNNVSPIYGTDGRIIFTSDRPRNGALNLYPQLDEYEEAPTVTGLWSLDPATGDLFMMNHAPSGDFTPIIDSFGRVLFTQWDHMQRDQQADADKYDGATYGTFNYSDESAAALALSSRAEIYPEPRTTEEKLPNLNLHSFNQFFPWQINEDGTAPETLNHIGRHELSGYFPQTFTNDVNLEEYYGQRSRFNTNKINNLLQIKEDPQNPGKYYGVDAPEFGTHAAGQIVSLTAPPSLDADHIAVTYITHRETASFSPTPAPSTRTGHYRDPLPLSDGTLVAAHTAQIDEETHTGASIYDFRLKTLTLSGGYYISDQLLTNLSSKTISYWDPDTMVNFTGEFWELQPVEVCSRTVPSKPAEALGAPEQQMFDQAGVDVTAFQTYMRQNNLALMVSHNVTTRDDFDFQQPFNLRIPGGVQTLGQNLVAPVKIYDIKFLQIFQADQIRGTGGPTTPEAGRRVLAQLLHDSNSLILNPTTASSPLSSVTLGTDGSMAAFVPAQRAMTWQLTDPTGAPVVRERYWLTFQPGEIRVCASCHGVNDKDQAGNAPPTNAPQALATLLQRWKKVVNAPTAFTARSAAAYDGWILETSEKTNVGGTINNTSSTFYVGDSAANQQYRTILNFDTSALPDTAVITSAKLQIKKQGMGGTNPFTTHGNLLVDLRKLYFGTTLGLLAADFQAAATKTAIGIFGAVPVNGWYTATLNNIGAPYINRTGTTQFRLRFTLDDNNDKGADYLTFYSGNAPVANRPQLVIQYYVP